MSDDDVNYEYYQGIKFATEAAAARIAELEASLATCGKGFDAVCATNASHRARIAELEAERNALKAALEDLYDENADYIKINRLMRGDGTSALRNQVMVQARIALGRGDET